MFKQTIAVVQLFFVCSVLIGMLGYGVSLSPGDKTLKSSTNAGKAAGFIFFVLFLVSQQGHSLSTNIALVSYDIDYLPLILSALACFGLAKILNVWLRTRLAGVLALLLISCSLIALYAFVFIPAGRSAILYASLGGTLGALIERLLFERDSPEKADAARQS
jgi:hypothetical protein